jgi:putative sigma-54 modulation protein
VNNRRKAQLERAMKLSVLGEKIRVRKGLREHIARRVYFSLTRFGPAIDRIEVRVGDMNGPRGGIDKYCRIIVRLKASGSIVIEAREDDLYASVAYAAERVGRTVARVLDRRHHARANRQPRSSAEDGREVEEESMPE